MRTQTDQSPGSDHPVSVDALLVAVGNGQRQAFASLYDALAARIHGLVRRVLVDPAQSEEVVQEVFLEIWQHAPTFDPDRGRALSWIFLIAHRRAVDRVRNSQAGHDRDERIGRRDTDVLFDPVSETGETRLEGERARRALQDLPEPQREAIALAYFAGFSQSEIAAHLGLPIGTVKTRLRDGMIRLRRTLGVMS